MKWNRELNNLICYSMYIRCLLGLGWIMCDYNGKFIDGGMR